LPARASRSELRSSVSFITSALNERSPTAVAVRQTPLTATESPADSSLASADSTVSRTPSSVSSWPEIRPRSCTRPVNTRSPLLDPRRDQEIVAHPVAGQGERPDRIGDRLNAFALERVPRRAAAEDQRR